MPASKIELMFNKNKVLYIIYAEVKSFDAEVVSHAIKKKHGKPKTYKTPRNVYTDVWSLTEKSITVKIDHPSMVGSITVVKY